MPTTTTTTTATGGSATMRIAAPADLLYDLITDVARMGEWSPECIGAEVPGGAALREGATFTGRNERGDQAWQTTCTVTAAERPVRFAFTAGDDDTPTSWSYELQVVDATTTEVTESFDSVAMQDPEVAAQLEGRRDQLIEDVAATLQALKAVAERDQDG